ncbi:MAG TPA: hypothetical protein VF269_00725 [Rhodanobacteraceae bacterium]
MKRESVPQDHARAFMGHSKILYAEDASGHLDRAPSDGWEAEEIVLDQAIAEYARQAAAALAAARAGSGSTLAFHMFDQRMDMLLLAQSTGYPRWRVRRHLRVGVFARLSPTIRARYAEALGKTPAELDRVPESA